MYNIICINIYIYIHSYIYIYIIQYVPRSCPLYCGCLRSWLKTLTFAVSQISHMFPVSKDLNMHFRIACSVPIRSCWFSIGPWCAVSVCDAISSTTKWPLKIYIHPSIRHPFSAINSRLISDGWLCKQLCSTSLTSLQKFAPTNPEIPKTNRQTSTNFETTSNWFLTYTLGTRRFALFHIFHEAFKASSFPNRHDHDAELGQCVCVSVNHHTDPGPKLLDASNCNTGGSWYHAYIAARARWKRTKAVKGAKMKLEFSVYTDWDYFLRYRSDRLLCEAQNTKTRGHLGLLFNTLTVFHHVCNVFLLPRRGVSSGAVRLRSQYLCSVHGSLDRHRFLIWLICAIGVQL